jgi:hypothetical protein
MPWCPILRFLPSKNTSLLNVGVPLAAIIAALQPRLRPDFAVRGTLSKYIERVRTAYFRPQSTASGYALFVSGSLTEDGREG